MLNKFCIFKKKEMKKINTLLVAIMFSFSLIGQVEYEQGIFLMEMGSNGFKSQNINSWEGLGGYINNSGALVDAEFSDVYDKYAQSEFQLEFGGAYFVIDGLAVGLGLNYQSKSTTVEYASDPLAMGFIDYDDSESELVISPGIRYYFGESGVWTQLSYALATINLDDSAGSYDDTEFPKRNAINISAGYAISLNDYVSLNPTLGYNLTTQTTKDGGTDSLGNTVDEVIKSSTFSLGATLTVHLSSY
jgi:hypothetical protein